MYDSCLRGRGHQEKRQPSFPPLIEDDEEHAEIDPTTIKLASMRAGSLQSAASGSMTAAMSSPASRAKYFHSRSPLIMTPSRSTRL